MFEDEEGPIEHFSWGTFIVQGTQHSKTIGGKKGVGKDIRLIGSEVSKWKERKGHELNFEMITGIFDQGIEILIIGTGMHGMVTCPDKVVKKIKNKGIQEVICIETPDACKLYNQFYHQGKKVALLAHGTC